MGSFTDRDRFAEEPDALQRHTVEPGSPAHASAIEEFPSGSAWISVIGSDGRTLPVRSNTRLRARDVVLTQVGPDHRIDEWFTALGT